MDEELHALVDAGEIRPERFQGTADDFLPPKTDPENG